MSAEGIWRGGGCHCGAVRFEARLADEEKADTCTCSICRMTGFVHIVVPESHFRLLTGEEELRHYRFNSGVADHMFCNVCGVKSFYRPRSNPDGWSVNARCLDEPSAVRLQMGVFDGAHWEDHWRDHGSEMAQRSREGT